MDLKKILLGAAATLGLASALQAQQPTSIEVTRTVNTRIQQPQVRMNYEDSTYVGRMNVPLLRNTRIIFGSPDMPLRVEGRNGVSSDILADQYVDEREIRDNPSLCRTPLVGRIIYSQANKQNFRLYLCGQTGTAATGATSTAVSGPTWPSAPQPTGQAPPTTPPAATVPGTPGQASVDSSSYFRLRRTIDSLRAVNDSLAHQRQSTAGGAGTGTSTQRTAPVDSFIIKPYVQLPLGGYRVAIADIENGNGQNHFDKTVHHVIGGGRLSMPWPRMQFDFAGTYGLFDGTTTSPTRPERTHVDGNAFTLDARVSMFTKTGAGFGFTLFGGEDGITSRTYTTDAQGVPGPHTNVPLRRFWRYGLQVGVGSLDRSFTFGYDGRNANDTKTTPRRTDNFIVSYNQDVRRGHDIGFGINAFYGGSYGTYGGSMHMEWKTPEFKLLGLTADAEFAGSFRAEKDNRNAGSLWVMTPDARLGFTFPLTPGISVRRHAHRN